MAELNVFLAALIAGLAYIAIGYAQAKLVNGEKFDPYKAATAIGAVLFLAVVDPSAIPAMPIGPSATDQLVTLVTSSVATFGFLFVVQKFASIGKAILDAIPRAKKA